MQRKSKIILVLLFLLPFAAAAQPAVTPKCSSSLLLNGFVQKYAQWEIIMNSYTRYVEKKSHISSLVLLQKASSSVFGTETTNSAWWQRGYSISSITPDTYYNGLGYICKKELAFERITWLPLRFRLGSLEYVNRLEGKIK